MRLIAMTLLALGFVALPRTASACPWCTKQLEQNIAKQAAGGYNDPPTTSTLGSSAPSTPSVASASSGGSSGNGGSSGSSRVPNIVADGVSRPSSFGSAASGSGRRAAPAALTGSGGNMTWDNNTFNVGVDPRDQRPSSTAFW